jgi:hypothetical protein
LTRSEKLFLIEEKLDKTATGYSISCSVGVSKSAEHAATELLKLKPYRTAAVYQLVPLDAEERIN